MSVGEALKMQTSAVTRCQAGAWNVVLHHLGTLGPAWEQQFRTKLTQLSHWTKAEASELPVIAYVRHDSGGSSLPLRAGGNIQPAATVVDLLVQHNVRARSAQDADVCSDGVPGQCLEAALLHHLGTLGPVRQQQFLPRSCRTGPRRRPMRCR